MPATMTPTEEVPLPIQSVVRALSSQGGKYGLELTGFDLEIGSPVPLLSEEDLETTRPDHYTVKIRYHADSGPDAKVIDLNDPKYLNVSAPIAHIFEDEGRQGRTRIRWNEIPQLSPIEGILASAQENLDGILRDLS